jgi:hypothetical protein
MTLPENPSGPAAEIPSNTATTDAGSAAPQAEPAGDVKPETPIVPLNGSAPEAESEEDDDDPEEEEEEEETEVNTVLLRQIFAKEEEVQKAEIEMMNAHETYKTAKKRYDARVGELTSIIRGARDHTTAPELPFSNSGQRCMQIAKTIGTTPGAMSVQVSMLKRSEEWKDKIHQRQPSPRVLAAADMASE